MSPRKGKLSEKEPKVPSTRRKTSSKKTLANPGSEVKTGSRGNGHKMEDLYGLISKRAYELFLQRGGQPGHDFEDWLEAEREILGR